MFFYCKLKLFFIVLGLKNVESALLYPQFTVMQLIGSLSVPITDLPPIRKVFFDWGLQMNYDMPFNFSSFHMSPIWATSSKRESIKRQFSMNSRAVHQHDFTAKELYEGIENLLEKYGFDRSCLKQAICELSQHPFDGSHSNVAADVINFFLKPSIHEGFQVDENYEAALYELAEKQGVLGSSCQTLYPQCVNNLFNVLTTTEFS